MKLINRPITEEYSFSDIYRKERLYQPRFQKFRLYFTGTRNPWFHGGWCHLYRCDFWDLTKRFIRKNIGKSFGKTYSEYCKSEKFKKFHDKDYFLDLFANPRLSGYDSKKEFRIDKEGRIQWNG